MSARGATAAWVAYLLAAGAMAVYALLAWLQAGLLAGPVLYGEGAVVHAAILTRTLATYADQSGAIFTAANYPPLYFVLASPGDPFVTGRVVSIAATLAVAGAIAWRARAGGGVAQAALALGWLALVPVAIWGPALKPDLVALALTVGGVLIVERRRAGPAAGLLVLAVAAKPTAIAALVALLVWIAWRDRALLRRFVLAAAGTAAVVALALVPFGYDGVWRHVVTFNALPWSVEQALLLGFLAIVILAALAGVGLASSAFTGPIGAYAVAAVVVVALGGREGATINYLLDLSAAGSLALASIAGRLRRAPVYPAAALLNLIIAALLLDPLGVVPGRAATTGAWGDQSRVTAAAIITAGNGVYLAEDSGLLLATGHSPVVDDLFLWSRLAANGVIDRGPLLAEVAAARFTIIISEVDLAELAAAPAYERARWDPALVRAINDQYRLISRSPGGLFIYRPR